MTLALAALLLLSTPCLAGVKIPFGPGERFTYDIYWTVVKAGSATLEVRHGREIEGKPTLNIHAKARTTPFIDSFYKVRDVIDSWTDPAMTRSYRHRKNQREGSYRKDSLVIFDWDAMKTRRYVRDELRDELKLDGPYFDPLAMLFNFRKHILYKTMRFSGPVTDGKVLVQGKAYVAGKNVLDTPMGAIDCFRVELDTADLSGVFKKSDDASLTVWFSADERRIPVRVKSSVVVGHFSLELTGYRPPDTHVAALP